MTSRYDEPQGSMKCWAEDDRPREKLISKGRHSLTETELLAILINTGVKGKSALDLARALLASIENELFTLGKMTVNELTAFEGIGTAKAVTLIAALELGRRKKDRDMPVRSSITCSKDIYELMFPVLADLEHEEFWIILLNRANKVIFKQKVSMGGVAGTIADPKIIFRSALDHTASSVILCHNHPSGNLKPSTADIELTRKLALGANLLDISVLDHLIFTDSSYVSFADEGWMKSYVK